MVYGVQILPRGPVLTVLLLLALSFSCKDAGSDPPPLLVPPDVVDIIPDSAAVGDTIRIIGTGFGSSQGSSVVRIGATVQSPVVLWSDSEIRVVVSAGSVSGSLTVTVEGVVSSAISYIVEGAPPVTISYASDIHPLFAIGSYGCSGCHAGNGTGIAWYHGTASTTYGRIVGGASNASNCGAVMVVPGNSSQSVLYLRLQGTCSGEDRMPQGANPISSTHLSLIQQWIDQGASP